MKMEFSDLNMRLEISLVLLVAPHREAWFTEVVGLETKILMALP